LEGAVTSFEESKPNIILGTYINNPRLDDKKSYIWKCKRPTEAEREIMEFEDHTFMIGYHQVVRVAEIMHEGT
jgi:hypothetical protein